MSLKAALSVLVLSARVPGRVACPAACVDARFLGRWACCLLALPEQGWRRESPWQSRSGAHRERELCVGCYTLYPQIRSAGENGASSLGTHGNKTLLKPSGLGGYSAERRELRLLPINASTSLVLPLHSYHLPFATSRCRQGKSMGLAAVL